MDVDLNKMTAKLDKDQCWDEVIIKRLQYTGMVEFSVGRWTSRNGMTSRIYEIVSHSEKAFMPAYVAAKRDIRRRLSDKKATFGIIKYHPKLQGVDETLVAILTPKDWMLHELQSDPVRTESNNAR